MANDQQDAFGQALYDYFLKGERNYEITERDDGYINCVPIETYFLTFDKWPESYKEAVKYIRRKVLDIGCGAGRHLKYLKEQGFDVTGIDASPLAVKVCKMRGIEKVKNISISQLNSSVGKFDTIIMLGNNFGLMADYCSAKWLLKIFYRITLDNGRIVAEIRDPYKTDEKEHLKYHQLNKKRNRMAGQLRLRIRYKTSKTPWFDYLFVSQDEMEYILENTGWRVSKYINSEGSPYIAIIDKET